MSVATTLIRLRELALALPRSGCDWEQRPHFDSPASPQSIVDLEQLAGLHLPADLREFLEQTASIVALSVHNGYWIGGIDQLIKANKRGYMPSNAEGESVMPIATDGGGNAFLLAADGRIWRWDHETGKLEIVAKTFGAFLTRIAEDWEAYISDRADWRYLV